MCYGVLAYKRPIKSSLPKLKKVCVSPLLDSFSDGCETVLNGLHEVRDIAITKDLDILAVGGHKVRRFSKTGCLKPFFSVDIDKQPSFWPIKVEVMVNTGEIVILEKPPSGCLCQVCVSINKFSYLSLNFY